MTTMTISEATVEIARPAAIATRRLESIDLLRGLVMVIMALDHVRDYFHANAFIAEPTDLSQTSTLLFLTRWITHLCAPIFVFLAGTSAFLYGVRRSKAELAFFLLTRGMWLVVAELFIVTFEWTFNPTYPIFTLQVIWAIGAGMICLSALIHLNRPAVLLLGIVLVTGHNLLDSVHVPGSGVGSFLWALLHETGRFSFGSLTFIVRYPLLPWLGILCVGYGFGGLYAPGHDAKQRQHALLFGGFAALLLFFLLRIDNFYGDAAHWSRQASSVFDVLSFINVSKYPPSLQYTLITLGPALLFLAVAERPLNRLTASLATLGRVPMFYYLAHLFLIHLLAILGAVVCGYHWSDMILSTRVNASPQLKGYGFDLGVVYIVWISVVVALYPLCKWFDGYKRRNQSTTWWLSYL